MSAPTLGRNLVLAATVIVIATLAAALWVMESPSMQRDRRLDQRRIDDLQGIVAAVEAWHARTKQVPPSLLALSAEPVLSLPGKDPVSGEPYAYQATSANGYRLCAVFATSTADAGADAGPYRVHDSRWLHPAGRHCFDRSIDVAKPDAAAVVAP